MARSLRILLAEDNPGAVFLVRKALSRHSIQHELTIAQDGNAAWKLIEAADASRAKHFDVFILDLNLPVRPGLEILGRIRTCRSAMSHAVVLIFTSSGSRIDREAAACAGADHFFRKPSSLEAFLELGAVVRNLCEAQTPASRRNISKGAGL